MASKKDNLPVHVSTDAEQEQGSSIIYAPEVLNIITQTAVNEVEGVAGMCNPSGGLLRKNNANKGLRIEQSPEEVSVELYLIVEYDRPIQKVAQEVQENVRRTVEGMTGMHVVRVDVHVMGVSFEKENTVVESAKKKAKLTGSTEKKDADVKFEAGKAEITLEDEEEKK
ncbi:MAG: Asp23/Gls24 family envelope stress response protein [Clostridia bacterium]|nr:Asp23/Gls24 family envelope stress response protein [Clostridia bacterium]